MTTTQTTEELRSRMPAGRWVRELGWRHLVGVAAVTFAVLPIVYVISASLSPSGTLTGSNVLFSATSGANYAELGDTRFWTWMANTLQIGVVTAVGTVLMGAAAAYAFSRFRFAGDKHLFFWLLTNRMTPPAVFLLPFFQLYTALDLMDTHIAVALAHMVFNVPLAVWILEGFMSGVPREIDETAYIDGYSFPRFFLRIFLPLIKAGIGVTAFFCFMFSWVELLLARTLTSVDAKPIAATMTRTVSAAGMDWGTLAAAGVLTIVPGALVIYFVRHYIAKGFAMGRV